MPKRRKSYTPREKLEIVEIAEKIGNRKAGRQEGAPESSIREWRKNKHILQAMKPTKRALRYRKEFWPELEDELKKWVLDKRSDTRKVSTIQIRFEAIQMAKRMKISGFKASCQWCDRFMKRKRLSMRAKTSVGQRLPEDWKEKVIRFKTYVDNKKVGVKPEDIGNMDEVPVSFDMVSNFTVDEVGAKDVKISSTGNEKSFFTVVLCVTADGGKCPPLIIFKRKIMPKEAFPSGIHVRVNEKGWVNEGIIKDWLKTVWKGRKSAFFKSKQETLLIWDSARPHLTDGAQSLAKTFSELAVIPGGLTKILQPLDLSVNKSFKSKLRNKWEEWMSNGLHSFTKSGSQRKATMVEICNWIKESWDEISVECIQNGFRKAGIYDQNSEITLSDLLNKVTIDSESDISEDDDREDTEEIVLDIRDVFEIESDSDFDGFD